MYKRQKLPAIIFSSPRAAWSIEISQATNEFVLLSSLNRDVRSPEESLATGIPTLKISGINIATHDDSQRCLEMIANSLFFDLDLRCGTPFRLVRYEAKRPLPALGQPLALQLTTELPVTKYAQDPLALYWYARSASGMPLLQFLAYYQVLEFHFPVYSRAEALRRLRQELRDPRFNIDDDSRLGRIVDLASRSASGFGNERDHLKATLRACLDEHSLRELLTSSSEIEEHFTRRSQIRGTPVLNLRDRQSDLRDQLAQRIYNLRCRIVHTKDAESPTDAGLLLPYSSEAEALTFDIGLLRTVAQQVLISGASTLHVTARGSG